MIRNTITILFLLATSMLLWQCKKSKEEIERETVVMDSLVLMYSSLNDSINVSWHRMTNDDDEKLFFLRRLLLEISYTNNYDKTKHSKLLERVDSLATIRYDQQTMSDSDLIDYYDSLSSAVAYEVITFAREHPEFEKYGLMQELINDISEKSGNVLIYRIHYDNYARERNQFIEANKKLLETSMPDSAFAPMPLFALPG
ncbi:MAG: hypothetical protein ACFCUU_06685 [Cyclobacteriaceae bacterium]